MTEEQIAFLHASYVAFVFTVLLFGALAYRQVLDNADVRRLQMGEDRDSFLDGPAALLLGLGLLALVPVCIYCYGIAGPSIYAYALPQVAFVQLLQLGLRLYFQRTLVRTKGLVVRSVLFDKVRPVPYADIVAVRLTAHKSWTHVVVSLPSEEVGFRIFSASVPTLERLLAASTTAPVLWHVREADELRRRPPATP